MIVRFHEPRRDANGRHEVHWPEGWPPPRIGEIIMSIDNQPLQVSSVTWQPNGPEPHAYVVLRYHALG